MNKSDLISLLATKENLSAVEAARIINLISMGSMMLWKKATGSKSGALAAS